MFKLTRSFSWKPKILGVERVYKGNWLNFEKVRYLTQEGKESEWEFCSRPFKYLDFDNVKVLATTKEPTKLLVIAIYRWHLENYILEFPAGLIEQNQTAQTNTVKELQEETGYQVKPENVQLGEISCNDPWKSNEKNQLTLVEINYKTQQCLEPDEEIQVFLLPTEDLLSQLTKLADSNNWGIDSRLYYFAKGLSLS